MSHGVGQFSAVVNPLDPVHTSVLATAYCANVCALFVILSRYPTSKKTCYAPNTSAKPFSYTCTRASSRRPGTQGPNSFRTRIEQQHANIFGEHRLAAHQLIESATGSAGHSTQAINDKLTAHPSYHPPCPRQRRPARCYSAKQGHQPSPAQSHPYPEP